MADQQIAARTARPAWVAIVLLIGLFGAIVGAVFAIGSIAPLFGLIAGVVGLVLYPGLAGIVAARSRSSDAVVALATLVPTLLFTMWVLTIIGAPWGWPAKRQIAIAIGACLLFAAVLFGTLLAAASVARPGGVLRTVAAISVGAQAFVLLAVPSVLLILLQSNHT
jgi:hypothetical protein